MKLSVITINYNNRDGLRKTIESVVAQTTRDFEYIVIDGGSTDGSVDVIKEYADRIDYWVSEPDKGIYNAMNKGVRAANGDFCQFLNSGDWYESTIVAETVVNVLSDDFDIISGYTVSVDDRGIYRRQGLGSPKHLVKIDILNNPISHPSSFIKRELLLRNPYDETKKIAADWIFFIENLVYHHARYCHIELDVVIFNLDGISSQNPVMAREEGRCIRDRLIHPDLFEEVSSVPAEIYPIFKSIPTSYRFRGLLVVIISWLVKLYGLFRKFKYTQLDSDEITFSRRQIKKINENYRSLR